MDGEGGDCISIHEIQDIIKITHFSEGIKSTLLPLIQTIQMIL